jgi:hypothetical protein
MSLEPQLQAAVDAGLLTPAEAESLDRWSDGLATELTEGRLTEDEMHERIIQRLERDLARRGVA